MIYIISFFENFVRSLVSTETFFKTMFDRSIFHFGLAKHFAIFRIMSSPLSLSLSSLFLCWGFATGHYLPYPNITH